jgi:type I phosphodiesterase/nucleotide pyrophosphatase
MRRRMLVLLVDALGARLASSTPGFGSALPHRRTLDTVLGFSAGALPTLFTGRMPAEHGRFVMYRRAGGRSVFRGFGALGLLPPGVRQRWRVGQMLARVVRRRGVRGYFQLYEVPRALLPAFDLAEKDDPFTPGGLPLPSLWDTLEARGVAWRRWDWRGDETAHLAAAGAALAEGRDELLFCYTAELDALLHAEGSCGAGVAARLARYERWLTEQADAAARRGESLWIYLVSDHGMVDIAATVDVMGALGRLPVRWPRDYLAFFDATMARFWWRGERARGLVQGALGRAQHGRWLTPGERAAAGITVDGDAWGEDVFLLDPGMLLVPSFVGHAPLRAMHGYDPAHPDMAALLWSNRPVPAGVRHIADVRGFLEAELAALAREAA